MKIFLGISVLVIFAVHHVTSLGHGHGHEMESWRTNNLFIHQHPNIINPLLGSPTSLNVFDNLQNIRNKLEEIEKKNTDLPDISPIRGHENQFQAINSFVDDLSSTNDNKQRGNAFEIRPFSVLEKVPAMPSALNGYFLMFRLKQNISKSVPTKSQYRFTGNEQQQYIQQLSTQQPEPAVTQQQPFTIHRQITSQQSLNNQQIHNRRVDIQDQSSNHGNHGQQNLVNQQPSANNQGHHLSEPHRLNGEQQPVNDQRSTINSQQFSSNEGSMSNGQQNRLGSLSTEKGQHLSVRNQQTLQQQTSNTQQRNGQQGVLSISHESTINQYVRPQERIPERIASNLPSTENPAYMANNFEYHSSPQIQALADEILAKIKSHALNGDAQSVFADNLSMNPESRNIPSTETSYQGSMMEDLDNSSVMPETGTQIVHETRVSSGASVKQHLKTPYANYDFTHLLKK